MKGFYTENHLTLQLLQLQDQINILGILKKMKSNKSFMKIRKPKQKYCIGIHPCLP